MPSSTDATLSLLESERGALLRALEAIPAEMRGRRPQPASWSAIEIVEHLARVERSVARLLATRGKEPPAELSPAQADARLTPERAAGVRDRSHRIEAPERVRPAGTSSYAEAMQALTDGRAALLEAYRTAHPLALEHVVHPHLVLGPLTLGSWVHFVAHHEARHTQQLLDIARDYAEE